MLDKVTALATAVDMEVEPFIRRLCTERTELANTKPENKLEPVTRDFGYSVGQPIDRYYIDLFLEQHCEDIHGCVMEIADSNYTKRFGGSRVVKSEVLHTRENENATLIGDLATGQGIPRNSYDCIILTQTLPFIYDVKSAIANCHKALKHGGVLLCTVNGISQISRYDMDRWGDFWRFTNLSIKQLLLESFEPSAEKSEPVSVTTFGNILTATAFLKGLPSQELQLNEMNHHDQYYQVLIGARALKY